MEKLVVTTFDRKKKKIYIYIFKSKSKISPISKFLSDIQVPFLSKVKCLESYNY